MAKNMNFVSDQTEGRLHRDATLITAGPPALYQLKTERTYIDKTNEMIRRWTYGRRDRNKQNKVILMMGETGSGKSTIINTMVNYLLGVKFEDEVFYLITEEEKHKDQTQSQTSEITVYEVFVEGNPTSLSIIDAPGYGDTEGYEKDQMISEYLSRLFSEEDGIHDIDAVCFVIKASQNRLSGKEFYIFHSVLSLFGKDIENNIVFLLTQSGGGPPTDTLNAIKKAEIPSRKDEDNQPVYFLFNNQQKEKRDKRHKRALKSAWEMGEESLNEFFTLLEEKNSKSLQMTSDVLNERRRLEACIANLMERISVMELKTKALNQTQEDLRQNRDKIRKCEDFPITVQEVYKEKVPISPVVLWSKWFFTKSNNLATSCSVCEETCHNEYGCWWVPFDQVALCEVMSGGYCSVCTNKCHYSEHIKENKKYVAKTRNVTMTFNEFKQKNENGSTKNTNDEPKYEEIKQEHESTMKEFQEITEIEIKLSSDLEKIKNDKSNLLREAYLAIMNLSKIALKTDSAFTLQHLDYLIPKLKEEGKDEWVKDLEDLKKMGEQENNKKALDHVKGLGLTLLGRVTGKK